MQVIKKHDIDQEEMDQDGSNAPLKIKSKKPKNCADELVRKSLNELFDYILCPGMALRSNPDAIAGDNKFKLHSWLLVNSGCKHPDSVQYFHEH